MAGEAFKDARVVKAAGSFVPVLVDGDVDKEFGKEWNASGYPHVLFVNAKGKELGRVRGYVPTARFLASIQGALKKNGPVRLSKKAKTLAKADADLATARARGDWRATLRAVAAIEKVGHDGPALARAREARAGAEAEANRRIESARALLEEGKLDDAKKVVRTIRSELSALKDAAKAARALLKEIAAAEKGA